MFSGGLCADGCPAVLQPWRRAFESVNLNIAFAYSRDVSKEEEGVVVLHDVDRNVQVHLASKLWRRSIKAGRPLLPVILKFSLSICILAGSQ
jgi:hypothetical protein